jgi:hypothetical protein
MKKIIALILLLGMTLTMFAVLSACGEKEDDKAGDANEATGDGEPTTEAPPSTTPAPTEPPTTTEPPPPKEYDIVRRYTFDDPENIGWRGNGQVKEFRIEDGVLKMLSTGGDPNFTLIGALDIAAEEIDLVRIRALNKSESGRCQMFFDTSDSGGLAESKSFRGDYWNYAEDNEEWEELLLWPDDCSEWEGNIKTIRFDMLEGEGEYWVEYISFEKEKK